MADENKDGNKNENQPGNGGGENGSQPAENKPPKATQKRGTKIQLTRRIVTSKCIVFEKGQKLTMTDQQLEATGLNPEFYEVLN